MPKPTGSQNRLDQADEIIRRLRATYTEAKEALDAADGDTLGALAYVEQARAPEKLELPELVSQVAQKAVETARAGGIRAIRLRLGQSVVRDLPVAMTGLLAAVVVCGAMVVSHTSIELEETQPTTEQEPQDLGTT